MTTNNPLQDQTPRLKIVLLDDDRLSAQNHTVQLKFAGESPLATTSDSWQQIFSLLVERKELARVLAIAVGVYKGASLADLLVKLHAHSPMLPILLLTGVDTLQLSALPDSLKARLLPLGDQSVNSGSLAAALRTARQLMGHEKQELPSRLQSPNGSPLFRSLSGDSPKIKVLRQLMMQAAKRAVHVLVMGETGTGKEVVARNVHYHGGRAGKPFRVVNCAAVEPGSFATELFGVEQGVLGGRHAVPGLLEQANGGTVLFDEINELPLAVQAKLVRFLEDQSYQRVGGHELLTADVRVIVGTCVNLLELVQRGLFREDLYYRINVVPLELPPLRERLDDIPVLLSELISSLENKGYESIRFNSAAIQMLQAYRWPGNIRELANLVERLALMQPDEVIGVSDLPPLYQGRVAVVAAAENLQAIQAPVVADASLELPTAEKLVVEKPVAEDVAMQKPQDSLESAAATPDSTPAIASATTAPAAKSAAAKAAAAYPTMTYAVMPPLNAEHLRQYLEKLEKHMLEVALEDCAGLLNFTADRMNVEKDKLLERLRAHGLEPATSAY
jgi:sigma-54 dependent transcriptional regulator, flagellar regulatory protein